MWQTWISRQWQKRGVLAWVLLPLSLVYGLVCLVKKKLYQTGLLKSYQPPVPVVVVGNIYVGGTGKTPVILSLISGLRQRGWTPGLVSRGYGSGKKSSPATGAGHIDASQFGDETAMVSQKTGISVSVFHDRAAAVQHLLQFDPAVDIILSDDGLQHWKLGRDIELLVQDERRTGNGWLIPAGPLREPVSRLSDVDAILTRTTMPTPTDSSVGQNPRQFQFAVTIQHFTHLQSGQTLDIDSFIEHISQPGRQATKHVLAMAGIGVPERFFNELRQLGVDPKRCIPLPDHGRIDPRWLASQSEDIILMTEKDAIKLIDHSQNAQTGKPSSLHEGLLFDPVADPRIWVGVADAVWLNNNGILEWLDARLRDLKTRGPNRKSSRLI